MSTDHSTPQSIFGVTITRPVAILMVVIAVSVFGYVSYKQLPLNLMPDISYPTLTVRTEYPAAAPEEVESLISRPVEQQLGVVGHLVRISSVSRPGFSDVILEFTWDTDMNLATQDVREKLDQVTLPEEVKRPMILRYDPSLDPILRIGLYGGADLVTLRRIADEEIRRELEAVSGVAAVKIRGGLEEEIQVSIDEGQIALLGLGMGEINRRLIEENINVAGGSLKDGQTEYLVRTLNEFRSVDEIARMVVSRRNGSDVRLSDIAKVWKTHKERETITRVNGVESVEIDIHKEGDANIVAVARRVRDRLFGTAEQRAFVEGKNGKKPVDPTEKAQQIRQMTDFVAYHLPEGMHLELLSDRSTFIQQSIDEVKSTAIVGGLLAVGILYLFLRNLLHTLVIGVVIPVSVLATFATMQIFGVSLNIMSLGGLALGVGMLVDNSIVVLESIFRCREEGDSLHQAVVRGTGEVGGAVFSSTLTTVAVFFPIVFVEGVAGQIFGDMSLTVVFSLLASLGAALFFTPMLAAREWRRKGEMGRRSAVLTFGVVERIVARWQSGTTDLDRVLGILRLVPAFLLDLLKGMTLTLVAVLPVLLKGVISIIGAILSPFIHIVKRLVVRRSESEEFTGWMLDDALWRFIVFQKVWKGLLSFTAPRDLRAGLLWVGRRLTGARGWRKGISGLLILPIGLYVVLRFFFQTLLEILGKLLTLLIVLIILLLISLLGLAGVVLLPIALPLLAGFERGFGAIRNSYPFTVRWALNNRLTVLLVSGALFVICLFVLMPGLGRELIPEIHQGEFNLEVAMPVGTPIETTDEKIRRIETILINRPDIRRIASIAGVEKSVTTSSDEGEHTGKIIVTLKGKGDLASLEDRVIGQIRQKLYGIPETTINIARPALFSFKTPVEVEIRGYSLDQLRRVSSEIETLMKGIENLYDVKANIQRGHPEVRIIYDRNLLTSYGLNIYDVAALVRNKVEGHVPTRFKGYADREIDILVRVGETYREGVDDLKRLIINPGREVPIPLTSVAQIRVDEGPSEIRRIDQQRAAVVRANIAGRDLAGVTRDIEQAIRRVDMPRDFAVEVGGQNREMEISLRSLKFALILAMFLVYVVMASQFESLIHPFVIMFTIPLAVIGIIITLYALSIPLSVIVFIGMILLAGVVVNNAIVLVDYINQLRRKGMGKIEAIVTAGQVRLRPIMMTTGTTVLGLLPMALGLGEGAELRMPLAITVIAGLTSSTLLTLIVIPVVYSLMDRTP